MPENTTKAFSRIAMSLDLCTKEATGLPAVAAAHPSFTMDGGTGLAPRAITSARTKRQTFDYIQSVAARVERLKAAKVK